MRFRVVDTESAYRRMLAAPDAAARASIFEQELFDPFAGLVRFFGGGGPAAFEQWGMRAEQFGEERHAEMSALVEALASADAWNRAVQALEQGRDAFGAHVDRIALDEIVFGLYIADMSGVPQTRGYTGFGGIPGWIMTVYGSGDEYNLARVEAATVHELHHNVLGASSAQGASMVQGTVADYVVGEGLAEAFAAELYGDDMVGPWVSEFDESRLDEAKAIIRDGLDVSGFAEMRRYIFGDPEGGLPVNAGYAIGYRIVRAYMQRTGRSAVETTFTPARTIIADSRFFD